MPIRKPHPNAGKLRKDMPSGEQKLWAHIRRKQLGGYRFRRQHTIGPYIADFACVEIWLVIELDGDQHAFDNGVHDAKRDAFMRTNGWSVLRFWNNEIYDNMDGALEAILDACENLKRALDFEKSVSVEKDK